MPPVTSGSGANIDTLSIVKEVKELQSSLYDKASSYTKLVMALGYGGFFAAWSGTKPYLSPKLIVASALLMTISLVFFIAFEVVQAMVTSYLSIQFVSNSNNPDGKILETLQAHKSRQLKLTSILITVWKFVFPVSAITGLLGGGVLIYSFVASLLTMYG